MKVRWLESATNELEDIFVYILKHSPRSAASVARHIIERAESLGEFPFKGEETRRTGIRKLTVTNYPYVIIYRVVEAAEEVQILNVRHTARKQSPAEG
ncbi:type II toxin-antitoxin system RelE/ParE family toxin [Rhodopseudomonas sp. P2A-2r]|uniref:type II toxin-antitoxin system RelE/ParE family toxin n=1 Tax=unclassified Rhodopseudomonas TaxID=2638247 RepID=UPI0039B70074